MTARTLLAGTLLSLLVACGRSPQVSFHTLSVTSGSGHALAPRFDSVQVAAVHVPASLDRSEMVRQTGPQTVEIVSQHRWSAPLGEMARGVLSQDLQSRLPPGAVVMPEMPTTPRTAQIVVSLLQFGPDGSGDAVLVGSWSVSSAEKGEVVLRRDVSLRTGVSGAGADAAAAAMSELLGQLASQMATALAGGS